MNIRKNRYTRSGDDNAMVISFGCGRCKKVVGRGGAEGGEWGGGEGESLWEGRVD